MTEAKLYTALTGHAGLSALVGTRVFPVILPQNVTLPAVRYQRITGGQVTAHSGYTGLENPRYQIDAWANTFDAARAIAKQIRLAMTSATTFTAIVLTDFDDYEPEKNLFRISLDFSVWSEQL